MAERNDHNEKNAYKGSFLADFYIEVLGSLVPGLFALILSLMVLAPSAFVFCRSLQHGAAIENYPKVADFGLGTYGVVGILIVAAYVLGFIFYRQDPKLPDWKSASRVYRGVAPGERGRLAVQPTSRVPEGDDRIHPNDAQFPYFYLHEYLVGRGLDHLAAWVPWRGKDESTWKYRTKMFINLLKIRLQYTVPERCKDIVRNEAHVRLATSVWYATRWLAGVSVLGLLMSAAAVGITPLARSDSFLSAAVTADVLTLIFALIVKTQIERFIHYLRVREIVYVLETAHFAQHNGIDLHTEDFRHDGIAGVRITAAHHTSGSEALPHGVVHKSTDMQS